MTSGSRIVSILIGALLTLGVLALMAWGGVAWCLFSTGQACIVNVSVNRDAPGPVPAAPDARGPNTAAPQTKPGLQPVALGSGGAADPGYVALVIGNSKYPKPNELENPRNDATKVAAKLKALNHTLVGGNANFEVGRVRFEELLLAFEEQAGKAKVALIYYAGHGVEDRGENFLIPVDAKLDRRASLKAWGLPLTRVTAALPRADDQYGVIILDACRTSNFLLADDDGKQRSVGQRGLIVQKAPGRALIAYAASAGEAAADGDGANSPYVESLLKHMSADVDIKTVFARVQDDLRKSKWAQRPDTSDQIGDKKIAFALEPPKKPGDEFRDCTECPLMIVVPKGKFLMGAPESEREQGEPLQMEVEIVRDFAVGKFEVTFAEWDACTQSGGCNSYSPLDWGWGRGRRPVVLVSWHDAKEYVKWLNTVLPPGKARYRLLSEAEWEYAARAGTTTAYPWGAKASHEFANYGKDECCGGLAEGRDKWADQTAPVGQFPPNKFGLFDMHGNVFEWVEDCLHVVVGFCTFELIAGVPGQAIQVASVQHGALGAMHLPKTTLPVSEWPGPFNIMRRAPLKGQMMSSLLTRRLVTTGFASTAAVWPFALALAAFDQKHALLIGNRAYTPAVGRLKNTINDIDLIARALRVQSFEATKIAQVKDVGQATQFLTAVDGYLERLRLAGPGALGFFYYCGHGVADPASRRNYLIPTGVATSATPQLWNASVETATLFERLARHTGPQIVVLDCCRSELNLGGQATPAPAPAPTTAAAAARPSTRPQGRGLVAVATHRRANMYICHAASEGEPALDFVGNDTNGPFAKALNAMLRALPQRTTHDIFKQTQLRVRAATNEAQNPAMLDDLDAAASSARLFGDVMKIQSGPPVAPLERKDFALVIANRHAGSRLVLPRARSDGEHVAGALRACGFETEVALDLTRAAFFVQLKALTDKMRAGAGAASVVLFFTGYGAGLDPRIVDGREVRENFLLPNGLTPTKPGDINAQTCIAMSELTAMLAATSAKAIAIIKDANRPIADDITPKGGYEWGDLSRSLEAQHRNLLIVHAAQENRSSIDDAEGSLFARAIAKRLPRAERRSLQQVLNEVVADVFESSGGRQKPWFDQANDLPMFFADESALGRRQP